jgi:DNA repair protein RadD
MELRDYQKKAVDSALMALHERKNPLVVMPTGSGKSAVLGKIASHCKDKGKRVVVLTHRSELIEQDAKAISNFTDSMPAVYCAKLRRKEISQITVAGIQSIGKKAYSYDPFHLIIVDECHLIPTNRDTLYQTYINEMRKCYPSLRVLGLTATPYRLDSGRIDSKKTGGIFDNIAYEIKVPDLIDRGYLSPIRAPRTQRPAEIDLKGIKKSGGDYSIKDLELRANKTVLTQKACDEIISYGKDRKSWIIFASGVDHTMSILDYMTKKGVSVKAVTGKTSKNERALIIEEFKSQKIQCVVNCQVLTTGFDAPSVDLIAMITATMSTALYVQCLGRGTRVYKGKNDCLLLDYGKNVERHGYFDKVDVKDKKEKKEKAEAPVKICPSCGGLLFANAKQCDCGHLFVSQNTSLAKRYTGAVLSTEKIVEEFEVDEVLYFLHTKIGKPKSIRARHQIKKGSGLIPQFFDEYLCPEHNGYAKIKFIEKCRKEFKILPPKTAEEFLKISWQIKPPKKISVVTSNKYPEIINKIF